MNTNFKPVSEPTGAGNGVMQIVRGSKLVTIDNGSKTEGPLTIGAVFTGVFEGATPNKFNEEKSDYSLRASDGTLIILSETASLANQLSKVNVGELLQIQYGGKREITRKNGAKAEMHDYKVLRAVDAAE